MAFIRKLSRTVFGLYGPYDRILMQWVDLGLTVTLVAMEGRRPVGFVMVGPSMDAALSDHQAELLAIAVSPPFQGRGVGRFLLETAEATAGRLGVETLLLHTATKNVKARRLFARAGYEIAARRQDFYPKGQEAVELRKRLVEWTPVGKGRPDPRIPGGVWP